MFLKKTLISFFLTMFIILYANDESLTKNKFINFSINNKVLKKIDNSIKNQIIDTKKEIKNYYNSIEKDIDTWNKVGENWNNLEININKPYYKAINNLRKDYEDFRKELIILKNEEFNNLDIKNYINKQFEKKFFGKFNGIKETQNLINSISTYRHSNDIVTKYILLYTPLIKTTAYYLEQLYNELNKQKTLDFLIIKSSLIISKITILKTKMLLYFDKIKLKKGK